MTLDFALFNYFPYGGLQRDFLKTALECQKLGYTINVYTSDWQGEKPDGFNIELLPVCGSSNHKRMISFQQQLHKATQRTPRRLLTGFNKFSGLDIYFASDTCYREKAVTERSALYRITPRYRAYEQLERAVFTPDSNTLVLTLTNRQIEDFRQHYNTQPERFQLLPPGITRNILKNEKEAILVEYRKQLNLQKNDNIILLVGSNFKTKGLDRAITALASLNEEQRQRTHLLVVGGDNPKRFIKQASNLNVQNRVQFLGARDDIQQLMLTADLLIHPAYTESAGMVLVEAIAAGLPVITLDNCGYATHIKSAKAGIVLKIPFQQNELNKSLSEALTSNRTSQWCQNAIHYAQHTDLYSLHKKAARFIDSQARKLLSIEP